MILRKEIWVKQKSEFDTFDNAIGKILSVPHSELKKRMAEYKEKADANPNKRGPKPKKRKPA